MPRRPTKLTKKPRNEKKAKAEKFASELHFPGARRDNALFFLKSRSSADELIFYARHAIRNRDVLVSFHGNPFPTKVSDFFSVRPYGDRYSTFDEIKWGLFRASLYRNEINKFLELKKFYELSVLNAREIEGAAILDEIECRFGVSFWLLQNRFTHAQVWSGLEAKRELSRRYVDEANQNILASILISFISRRSEATGLKNYLQEELTKMLGGVKDSVVEKYMRTKLFDLGQMSVANIATTLLFDAQASLIDHYETLILILQSVVVDERLPEDVGNDILKYIESQKDILDVRVSTIARSLQPDVQALNINFDPVRVEIIENYSAGKYAEMLAITDEYLLNNPDDISICALRAKAIVISDVEGKHLNGLLNEICRLFISIMRFDKDSYGSAFALYTMHDRYYGHHWAVMARAVMNDVLIKITLEFPRPTFRHLISLDANLSPFTTFSLHSKARADYRKNRLLQSGFPATMAVLAVMLDGNNWTGDDIRLKTYKAQHLLIKNLYKEAAEEFSALTSTGHRVSRFFAAAYAALAYLKIDNIAAAVEAVVKGTIINRDVPIVMPIPEVVARLDDTKFWPDNICLPILFEFYTAYFTENKFAHLRVAFEKYQMDNSISEPEQLVEKIPYLDKPTVVTYLDKVWRPEVMMQTLLYETPKEIEDARIAVCRVLATIDSDNSNKYQEEIRDRVKRREIAKGTTLLEKSKVYVDIVAIKKSLNARLGDTYARYKAALEAKPTQPDTLVENIADLFSGKMPDRNSSITNALSKIHLLNVRETEIDIQFSALFSEVTNEFLRGDHGLNAYLSTRVRHGTLANTLRKPLADENLVTALKEDETGYMPNTFWDKDISVLSDDEKLGVKFALEEFTQMFDAIVENVKNKIIQIRVYPSHGGGHDDGEALFFYQSSNLERRFIQEYDRNVTNIGQFIDRCIEALWEKTDANLENVRDKIRTQVRSDFLDCFDRLSEAITLVSNPAATSNILNALARARTDFQTKIHLVESWFNRQAVYDRQDYLPEYAVQIALNMVQKTLPNKYQQLDVEIFAGNNTAMMPGRTLDGMVDVFASLLDNATIRSGLPIEKLKVTVTLSFDNKNFYAAVENNIGSDKPTQTDNEKIAAARESLNKTESRTRAQSEKGSGLLKIWRTIQSPVYKDPFFSFNYVDSKKFIVNISYNIERNSDEILVN